jgi:membrane associated rhomboid family serine protease
MAQPQSTADAEQALAIAMVGERQRMIERFAEPDARWTRAAGVLRLPVVDDEGVRTAPAWMTYTLIASCCAISISMWKDDWGPGGAAESLGVVGGLGSVEFVRRCFTSFFAHAGLWHLVVNAYFLSAFGGVAERSLGRTIYAVLLAIASIAGAGLHLALTDHPEIPLIGASSGISGVLAWFALHHPRRRIALAFGWPIWSTSWVHVSARSAFAGWFAIQLASAVLFDAQIAYTAHIGGALAGAFFWLAQKQLAPNSHANASPPTAAR